MRCRISRPEIVSQYSGIWKMLNAAGNPDSHSMISRDSACAGYKKYQDRANKNYLPDWIFSVQFIDLWVTIGIYTEKTCHKCHNVVVGADSLY